MRAPDEAVPQIALVTTVVDQLFCFAFPGRYKVGPASQQVAAYVTGMIEAVAFFGLAGAVLSVGIFLTGIVAAEGTVTVLGRGHFDSGGIFGSTMIVILIGTCLAAVSQVLSKASVDAVPREDAVHRTAVPLRSGLSGQEQDVLKMLAEGCSHALLASRLRSSYTRLTPVVQ